MSRHTVTVLRILAVGSALTVLACQISNRQQLATETAAAAGDAGSPGYAGSKPAAPPVRAAGTKSARMITPPPAGSSPQAPPQPTAPAPAEVTTPLLSPPTPPAAASNPAPTRVRGFGSKSAPAMTPSDIRRMQQQGQQSVNQR
ncbi:MAG TPA: hypothetical protein VG796_00445 [Verrucomicrobiales bacterium]|nr:hypothetical protein [Verrucomicrobiales bacterium]